MIVYCECCVLSGRGLCDGLIIPPEESYRLWCVVVCDLETSWMRRPWPTEGCCAKNKQTNYEDVKCSDWLSYVLISLYASLNAVMNLWNFLVAWTTTEP